MQRLPIGFCALVVPIAVLLNVSAIAADVSLIGPPDQSVLSRTVVTASAAPDAAYAGRLRLYLVEPVGRWLDDNDQVYFQGFLDFPISTPLNLADGEVWYRNATWDATTHSSIGFIVETNIEVIAVVTKATSVLTDAYPPNGYWFNAFYVDACAWATPGNPGTNEPAIAGYTHNVFIEEGTRTS